MISILYMNRIWRIQRDLIQSPVTWPLMIMTWWKVVKNNDRNENQHKIQHQKPNWILSSFLENNIINKSSSIMMISKSFAFKTLKFKLFLHKKRWRDWPALPNKKIIMIILFISKKYKDKFYKLKIIIHSIITQF